jgi:hypothetical protein
VFLFDETPYSFLGGLSETEESTNLFLPALKILGRLAAVLLLFFGFLGENRLQTVCTASVWVI